jgi:hypothetical protein
VGCSNVKNVKKVKSVIVKDVVLEDQLALLEKYRGRQAWTRGVIEDLKERVESPNEPKQKVILRDAKVTIVDLNFAYRGAVTVDEAVQPKTEPAKTEGGRDTVAMGVASAGALAGGFLGGAAGGVWVGIGTGALLGGGLYAVFSLVDVVGRNVSKSRRIVSALGCERPLTPEKIETRLNEIFWFDDPTIRQVSYIRKWGKKTARSVVSHEVFAGMPSEAARESWGIPTEVIVSDVGSEKEERWKYKEGKRTKYIFIIGGVVGRFEE